MKVYYYFYTTANSESKDFFSVISDHEFDVSLHKVNRYLIRKPTEANGHSLMFSLQNNSPLQKPSCRPSLLCSTWTTRVCATYGCTLKRSLYFHLFSSLKLCQMAQPCTRPLLNNLAKNLWSRYRGKRAGRSTKTKEANRTYKITQVNPRPKDHSKAKINSRGHDPSNCISITTKLQFTSVPEPQARNFVPSLFLSNVMSLAPKIDEVSHVVQNANYDLVCITESWLRQHIPDSVIAINGYNIIRRDRKEATHY